MDMSLALSLDMSWKREYEYEVVAFGRIEGLVVNMEKERK